MPAVEGTMSIRLVWGFLCQGSITPFLSSFCHSILLFDPRREHSSAPTALSIVVVRSGGQGRRIFSAAEDLSLTDGSRRHSGGWPRDDPRGACHWPRSIARTTLVFG
jgi:hypothetical protein